ncbi:hypothetical protein CL656_06905 [bacterium]|nr:hypothetical protein [bacterium]|tara:strand:+ start:142 stop:504 length:363 start_codon:yes stop_codon:yes gene_type:complete
MLIVKGDKLKDFIILSSVSIADALMQIEINSRRGVVVISDSNKVLGFLTDGDIRKSLIRGIQINSSVIDIINHNFKSIQYEPFDSLSERLLKIFKDFPEIEIIPLIDKQMNLIALGVRRD